MDNNTTRPKGLPGYIAITKRRRTSIIIAFACGLLATILLATLLPARVIDHPAPS